MGDRLLRPREAAPTASLQPSPSTLPTHNPQLATHNSQRVASTSRRAAPILARSLPVSLPEQASAAMPDATPASSATPGTLIASDGLRLFTQRWTPEPATAGVLLVHGYGEHSGRYDHVAEALGREGVAVYAFDLRGHGRSEGSRAYVESFDRYLEDLDDALDAADRSLPEGPLFLYGHSMGGLIVLRYVLERDLDVDGLILSSPAIEINPDLAPLLRRVAQWLGRVAPKLPTVRSVEGAISRDPAVVEAAENDPLNYHGRVQARMGAEMLRAGETVQARVDEIIDPFLVVHGTADTITSPTWSQRLYDRAAADDKTLHLYDGLYHETHNEPEQDEVLADIRTWLRERIPGSK